MAIRQRSIVSNKATKIIPSHTQCDFNNHIVCLWRVVTVYSYQTKDCEGISVTKNIRENAGKH